MLRIVFDTNIFVSALLFNSQVCNQCLNHWIEGRTMVFTSPDLISEITLTLKRKGLSDESLRNLVHLLVTKTTALNPQTQTKTSRDPKDDFLLDLTQAGQVDYLVTGDNDLLVLSPWQNTQIIQPRHFLRLVP